MRTIETKVYTIDEHPNKEKCFEWIRDNWHDLNQHSVDDVVCSIKKLSEVIGGTYDFSIGQCPDRGEHLSFLDYDEEALKNLNADDLPLTGVCYDADLIEGLQNDDVYKVLRALHSDSEYLYSDEGLEELCEANGYEFDEDGIIN